MKLRSDSFSDQQLIPTRYAFGKYDASNRVALADNLNPHLAWTEVPKGTKSFVILCVDSDVPSQPDDVNQIDREVPADLPRVDFYHWVLVDVAANVTEIPEGAYAQGVTPRGKSGPLSLDGTRQGINDFTNWFAHDRDMNGDYFGYDGPCPPWNDSLMHHYRFTVYALNIDEVALTGKFTGGQVLESIKNHIIGQASITGTYSLNPRLLGL